MLVANMANQPHDGSLVCMIAQYPQGSHTFAAEFIGVARVVVVPALCSHPSASGHSWQYSASSP